MGSHCRRAADKGMSLEECAAVLQRLRQLTADDPATRTRVRYALGYARTHAALHVKRGTYPTLGFAASICAIGVEFEPRAKLLACLETIVARGVDRIETLVDAVGEEVFCLLEECADEAENPPHRHGDEWTAPGGDG